MASFILGIFEAASEWFFPSLQFSCPHLHSTTPPLWVCIGQSSQHQLSQISTHISHREFSLAVSQCPFENHRVRTCSCHLIARAYAYISYTYVCICIHLWSLRLSVQPGAEFLETCVLEFVGPSAFSLPQALALNSFLILLELISLFCF